MLYPNFNDPKSAKQIRKPSDKQSKNPVPARF